METAFTELRVPLVISILFFVLACGRNTKPLPVDSATLNLVNANGTFLNNGTPFTGSVYTLFPGTKDTAETAVFLNGKEHGEWRLKFENGQLKSQRFYENGFKTKTVMEWWESGQMRKSGSFKNGETQGLYREWDENGQLIKAMNYEQGHEEGTQKQFYTNGKLKSNYVVKSGRRFGLLGTKNCVNVKDSIF